MDRVSAAPASTPPCTPQCSPPSTPQCSPPCSPPCSMPCTPPSTPPCTQEEEEEEEDGWEVECWDLPPWSPACFHLEEELERNPHLNAEVLKKLQEWASKRKTPIPLKEIDLVKFLSSCEYNLKETQRCIESYHSMRSSAPELFNNRDILSEKLEAQLQVIDCSVLPRRTPDGCRVFLSRLKHGDPSEYVFADHQKIMMMAMDACLMAEPTLPGFYFIYDLHLGQLSHFWKFSFWLQRKLYAYVQEGLPLKQRGVFLLHTPPFITHIMKFLANIVSKQKLETIVMLSGDDYSPMYEIIPRKCLPRDYGGILPTVEDLHNMTVERLAELRDFFKEEDERVFGEKKK